MKLSVNYIHENKLSVLLQTRNCGFGHRFTEEILNGKLFVQCHLFWCLITFQNNCFYLLQWTPFKNDDKCFSFRVKISFRSYQIFTFSSWFFGYVENALRKKLWLISKFITPNTGQQIIQYTYYPISQEVKGTRQWNLFS